MTTVVLVALTMSMAGLGPAHAARKSCLAKGPNGSCSVFVPGGGAIKITVAGVTSRNGGAVLVDGSLLARFGGTLQSQTYPLPAGFCSCVVTVMIDPPAGVLALSAQY